MTTCSPDLLRFDLARAITLSKVEQLKRQGRWKEATKLLNEIDPAQSAIAQVIDLQSRRRAST